MLCFSVPHNVFELSRVKVAESVHAAHRFAITFLLTEFNAMKQTVKRGENRTWPILNLNDNLLGMISTILKMSNVFCNIAELIKIIQGQIMYRHSQILIL